MSARVGGRRSPAAAAGLRKSPSPAAAARRHRGLSPRSRDSSATTDGVSDGLLEANQALTDDDVSLVVLTASQGGPPASPVDGGGGADESLLDSCFLKATPDSWNPGAVQKGLSATDDDRHAAAHHDVSSTRRPATAGSGSLLPSRSRSPGFLFNPAPAGGSGSSSRRPSPTPRQGFIAGAGGGGLQRSASGSSLSSRLPRWVGGSGDRRSEEADRSEASLAPDDTAATESRSLVQLIGKVPPAPNVGAFRSSRKSAAAATSQSSTSRRAPLRALSPAVSDRRRAAAPVAAGAVQSRQPHSRAAAAWGSGGENEGASQRQQSSTLAPSSSIDGDEDDSLRAPDVTSLVHDLYDAPSTATFDQLATDRLLLEQWQQASYAAASRTNADEPRGYTLSSFWQGSSMPDAADRRDVAAREDAANGDDDDDALPRSLLELLAAASSPGRSAIAVDRGDESSTLATSRRSLLPTPHSFDPSSEAAGAAASGARSSRPRSMDAAAAATSRSLAGSRLPVLLKGSSRSSSPHRNRSRPVTPSGASLSLSRPPTPSRIPMPAKRQLVAATVSSGHRSDWEAEAPSRSEAPLSTSRQQPVAAAFFSSGGMAEVGYDVELSVDPVRAAAPDDEREGVLKMPPHTRPTDSTNHIEHAAKATARPSHTHPEPAVPTGDSMLGSHDWHYYETGNSALHGNSDTDRQVSWPSSARNTNRTEQSADAVPEDSSRPKPGVTSLTATSSVGRKPAVNGALKATDHSKGPASKPATATTGSKPATATTGSKPTTATTGSKPATSTTTSKLASATAGSVSTSSVQKKSPRYQVGDSTASKSGASSLQKQQGVAGRAQPDVGNADSPSSSPSRPSMKGRFADLRGYTPPMVVERDDHRRRYSIASSEGNQTVGGSSNRTTRSAEEREVLSQLQTDYEELLTKYALAEVTIDQLRLGAKLHLEPSVRSRTADVQAGEVPGTSAGLHQLAVRPPAAQVTSAGQRGTTNGLDAQRGSQGSMAAPAHSGLMQQAAELEKQLEQLKASLGTHGLKPADVQVLLADYEKLRGRFERLRSDCTAAAAGGPAAAASGGGAEGELAPMDSRLLELEAKLELARSLLLLSQDRASGGSVTPGSTGQQQRADAALKSGLRNDAITATGPHSVNALAQMTSTGDASTGAKPSWEFGPSAADAAAAPAVTAAVSTEVGHHSDKASGSGSRAAEARSGTSSDDEMLERKQQQLQLLRRYKSLKKLPRTAERAKEIRQLAEQLQGCLRSTDSSEASHLSSAGDARLLAVGLRLPQPSPAAPAPPAAAAEPSTKAGLGAVAATMAGQQSSHDSGLSTPRLQPPSYVSTARLQLSRLQDSDSGFVPSEGGQMSPQSSRLLHGTNDAPGQPRMPEVMSPAAVAAQPPASDVGNPSVSSWATASQLPQHGYAATDWERYGGSRSLRDSVMSSSTRLLEDEVMPTTDGYGSPDPFLSSADGSPTRADGQNTREQNYGSMHGSPAVGSGTWASATAAVRTGAASTAGSAITALPQSPAVGAATSAVKASAAAAAAAAHSGDELAIRQIPTALNVKADASPSAMLSASDVGVSSNSGSSRDSRKSRRSVGFRALMKEMAQLRDDLRTSVLAATGVGAPGALVAEPRQQQQPLLPETGQWRVPTAADFSAAAAGSGSRSSHPPGPSLSGVRGSAARQRGAEAASADRGMLQQRAVRAAAAATAAALAEGSLPPGQARSDAQRPPKEEEGDGNDMEMASAGVQQRDGIGRQASTESATGTGRPAYTHRGPPPPSLAVGSTVGSYYRTVASEDSDPGGAPAIVGSPADGGQQHHRHAIAADRVAPPVFEQRGQASKNRPAAPDEHDLGNVTKLRGGRGASDDQGDERWRNDASATEEPLPVTPRSATRRQQRLAGPEAVGADDGLGAEAREDEYSRAARIRRRRPGTEAEQQATATRSSERVGRGRVRRTTSSGHKSRGHESRSRRHRHRSVSLQDDLIYSSEDSEDGLQGTALATCPACRGTGAATASLMAPSATARGYVRLPSPPSPLAAAASMIGSPGTASTQQMPQTVSAANGAWVVCPHVNGSGDGNGSAISALVTQTAAAKAAPIERTLQPISAPAPGRSACQPTAYGTLAPVSMAPVCGACGTLLSIGNEAKNWGADLVELHQQQPVRSATAPAAMQPMVALPSHVSIGGPVQDFDATRSVLLPVSGYLSTAVATSSGLGYMTVPVTLTTSTHGRRKGSAPRLIPDQHQVELHVRKHGGKSKHVRHATTDGYYADVMAALSNARGSAIKLRHLSSKMRTRLENEVDVCVNPPSRPVTR